MKVRIIKDNRVKVALKEFAALEMGKTMSVDVEKDDGPAFVQRMRVALSRLRNKIKAAKMNVAQIRLEYVKTEKVMKGGIVFDRVTIKKTKNGLTDVEDLVNEIQPLRGLVSGGRI